MTNESRQRRAGASIEAASPAVEAPDSHSVDALDELLLAMDVVDTLRHERRLIERELAAGDRDRRLIERLRAIYASQGISVADDVLARGVSALHEDRFSYTAPAPGLKRSLQVAYVTRGRWGKYAWAVIALGMGATAVVVLS